MLSMVTSAMFYEKDESSESGLQIGPFTLTVQQVPLLLFYKYFYRMY